MSFPFIAGTLKMYETLYICICALVQTMCLAESVEHEFYSYLVKGLIMIHEKK